LRLPKGKKIENFGILGGNNPDPEAAELTQLGSKIFDSVPSLFEPALSQHVKDHIMNIYDNNFLGVL